MATRANGKARHTRRRGAGPGLARGIAPGIERRAGIGAALSNVAVGIAVGVACGAALGRVSSRGFLPVAICLFILTPTASAQTDVPQALPELMENDTLDAQERLYGLFDLLWAWQLEEYPEYATYYGKESGQDRWTDYSLEAIQRREAQVPRILEAIRSIDPELLDARARSDHELVLRDLEDQVAGLRFPDELLVLNQMGGVQQDVPNLIAMMPASSPGEYQNIISRLRGVPRLVEQTMTLLEEGRKAGITPPRVTLRDVPEQVRNLMAQGVEDSPLMAPFERIPSTIPQDAQERLRQEAARIVETQVFPAYEALEEYLEEVYIPSAQTSVGRSALPDGAAWYQHRVRSYTTTDLTAQEIHDIGLREVARIRSEMEDVMREAAFEGKLNEFFEFLRNDPQFFFDDPEALLGAYRDIAKRADPELVQLFGTLPRLPYGVEAVPAFAEKSQTTAYYEPGSLAAGRPGVFRANTYNLKSRPIWEMEALTLHEAVPGHHLQIALSQEQPEAHDLRRHQFYTAFVEGWGLYAESLGEEMGFYQDPYSKFGRLTYEMWRAVRLVVDTGMHALGWSREEAIDYFADNAGKSKHDIVVEIDRYIVWPGQALAYKIGELKIKELRARAAAELGADFDVRAFHDRLLESGALPLDVLEERMDAWIVSMQEDGAR